MSYGLDWCRSDATADSNERLIGYCGEAYMIDYLPILMSRYSLTGSYSLIGCLATTRLAFFIFGNCSNFFFLNFRLILGFWIDSPSGNY
jgi:hypothetical protein